MNARENARDVQREPERAGERQRLPERAREHQREPERLRPDIIPTDSSKAHMILVTHVVNAVM